MICIGSQFLVHIIVTGLIVPLLFLILCNTMNDVYFNIIIFLQICAEYVKVI